MIEPNSPMGERARRLFWRAQELIRRQGIATQHGVQTKAGLITIHVTKWPPQSEGSPSQYAAAKRKWFPYRLDIWQRQHVMLSVNYNDTDEIEIAAFKRGVWEYRVRSVGMRSEQWPVRTNRNSPANEALVETPRASPPTHE
jgi:hypothetical protein